MTNVDVKAAKDLNIEVCNTPDGSHKCSRRIDTGSPYQPSSVDTSV